MNGLMDRPVEVTRAVATRVGDDLLRTDDFQFRCKPLWLTPREAEALLVLCVASPINGGSGEQELFAKLGDFFRLHRL